MASQCELSSLYQSEPANLTAAFDYYFGWLIQTELTIGVPMCAIAVLANLMNVVVLTRSTMRNAVSSLFALVACCNAGVESLLLIRDTGEAAAWSSSNACPLHTSYGWMMYMLTQTLTCLLLHSCTLYLSVLLAIIRLANLNYKTAIARTFTEKTRSSRFVLKCAAGIFLTLFLLVIPMIPLMKIKTSHALKGAKIYLNNCEPRLLKQFNETANMTEIFEKPVKCPVLIVRCFDYDEHYDFEMTEFAQANNCVMLQVSLWLVGIVFKLVPCLTLVFSLIALTIQYQAAKRRHERLKRPAHPDGAPSALVADFQTEANVATTHNQNGGYRTRLLSIIPGRTQIGHPIDGDAPQKPRRRSQFNGHITMMLMAVLSVVLVTELPQAVYHILAGLYPQDMYKVLYERYSKISDLLSLLNGIATFALYNAMNTMYRQTLVRLITTALGPVTWCVRRLKGDT